ncbi:MAG: PE domain-containing protein, partial [Mycobacterium sp.]
MDSMSHQPAAGDIGSQLVEIGSRGLDSAAASALSLTGLIPAGGDEVSAQAAISFAADAAAMLASNTAAQEELMRTGTALTDIAQMYMQADGDAAGALTV